MNLFGINLGQLFNPMFLLTGILLVTYFWLVGSFAKLYFKNFKYGSITLGFLSTMFLFGVTFITFRFGNESYQELFIVFIVLTSAIGLYSVGKNKIKPDFRRLAMMSIAAIATLVITVFVSNWYLAVNPNHDYWLYGQFITNGSNFEGTIIRSDNVYVLSNFYDFIGSFIGLINGPIKGFVGGLDQTGNVFENIVYVVQVPATIALVAILTDIVYSVSTKKKFLFVALVCIQTILPFQTGLLGPFLLFIPFALLLLDVKNYSVNPNMVIVYTIPFMFFVSSISFLIPFVVLFVFMVQGKLRFVDFLVYGLLFTTFAFSGKDSEGNTLVDWEIVSLLGGLTVLMILQKQLIKLVNVARKFMENNWFKTKIIFSIIVILYVVTTQVPPSAEMATIASIFIGRGIYALISLYLLLGIANSNNTMKDYLLAAVIFVSPVVNIVSSVFNVMERIPVIYHRIGNILLIGEMYMNVGTVVLLVLFAMQIWEKIMARRNGNDQLRSVASK